MFCPPMKNKLIRNRQTKSNTLIGKFFDQWVWPQRRFNFIRIWRTSHFYGAPISYKKYLSYVKKEYLEYWVRWHQLQFARFFGHNALLVFHNKLLHIRYFIGQVKSLEVNRTYIVTLKEDPPSLKAAKQCRQSLRQWGREAEYFYGVNASRAEAVLSQHGISFLGEEQERSVKGRMGCLASHFLLWLKCIELDEPILIVECDGLARCTIPPLRFKHIVNLSDVSIRREYILKGTAELIDKKHWRGSVYYAHTYLPNTMAYAIKPAGARRLVKAARTGLVHLGVDVFIRTVTVNIVEHHPLPVEQNMDFSSYIDRQADKEAAN